MPSRAQTIKKFAHEYFVRVNYIDIYGRDVGYDYDYILAEIKKQFPKARTSKRWLRMMGYELTGTVRMPMRRRSRRALAEGYAMTLLLKTTRTKTGMRYDHILEGVRKKFAEVVMSAIELRRLENNLRYQNFPLPPRPRT
jgi:hypothetical protein